MSQKVKLHDLIFFFFTPQDMVSLALSVLAFRDLPASAPQVMGLKA